MEGWSVGKTVTQTRTHTHGPAQRMKRAETG